MSWYDVWNLLKNNAMAEKKWIDIEKTKLVMNQ